MQENKIEILQEINKRKRALENEIDNSKDYIKLLNKKVSKLETEKDNIIDGTGNFDRDQLRLFDVINVKDEFENNALLRSRCERAYHP